MVSKMKNMAIGILIYIIGITVIIFNNTYQLTNSTLQNRYLLFSFLCLLAGVLFYYIYNQDKLKKLLR